MGLNTSLGVGRRRQDVYDADNLVADARFIAGAPAEGHERQYLIRVVAPDRRGNALRLAQLLARGVAGNRGNLGPFSIRESFTARLGKHGLMNLVVAPIGATSDEQTSELLGRALSEALPGADAQVSEFSDGANVGLFEKLSFRECRFAVEPRRMPLLAQIAHEISEAAGGLGVPIAYLFFPFRWPASPIAVTDQSDFRRLDWLRIAYGVHESDVVTSVRLENHGFDIAMRHGAVLGTYSPVADLPTMSGRFAAVRPQGLADVGPNRADWSGVVETDVVPARPGAVAETLRRRLAAGEDGIITGGAMSVLRGRSVMSWSVAGTDEVAYASNSEVNSATLDGRQVWVAWRCADEAGVFGSVLEEVLKLFPEANLEHSMTRVWRPGRTCAGKLLFDLPTAIESGERDMLRESIRERLDANLARWEPEDPAWADSPVMVDSDEPAENPWAEIVL